MSVSLCPFPTLLRACRKLYNRREIKAAQSELFPFLIQTSRHVSIHTQKVSFGYLLVFGHLVISRLINPWISESLLNTTLVNLGNPKPAQLSALLIFDFEPVHEILIIYLASVARATVPFSQYRSSATGSWPRKFTCWNWFLRFSGVLGGNLIASKKKLIYKSWERKKWKKFSQCSVHHKIDLGAPATTKAFVLFKISLHARHVPVSQATWRVGSVFPCRGTYWWLFLQINDTPLMKYQLWI